jgi:hypothetical protein
MNKILLKLKDLLVPGFCCILLCLSACATTSKSESSLEMRAMERWDALLSGNLDGAYQYLSPGYRSSVSSMQYQRSVLANRVKWTDASYIESDCTENTCNVRISLEYVIYGALPGVKSFDGTQAVDESWILTQGKWYFVPDK